MARGGGTSDEIERRAGRSVRRWLVLVTSIGVIGGWAYTGFYRLAPGEAAVVLSFGRYLRTEATAGLRWHVPRPIQSHAVIRLGELRREKFGYLDADRAALTEETAAGENAIQTADNNIVNMSYVVQYYVNDAFSFVYGLADPTATLRDAAQSALREVVGKHTGNEALRENRAGIQREAEILLQDRVDAYFGSSERSAFRIDKIEIQDSKAPAPVQGAFDDVVAARQDEQRKQAEARGDAREIVERAQAQAREVQEAAIAYRDAKLVEAEGEAARFTALLAEYQRAPEVTRERLYLETMESILPTAEKVIVEPGAAQVVPLLSIGAERARSGAPAATAGAAASAAAAEDTP
ncbi:MAG: FtsH protease activity modulator HflK [Myxococcota bacterium]